MNAVYVSRSAQAERNPIRAPNEMPLKTYTEPAWANWRLNSMKENEVRMMVMTAPRKARATAVPVIEAAREPFRAIAAVGAMMPTDRAMASMTPSCGRSLLMSPSRLRLGAGSK